MKYITRDERSHLFREVERREVLVDERHQVVFDPDEHLAEDEAQVEGGQMQEVHPAHVQSQVKLDTCQAHMHVQQ